MNNWQEKEKNLIRELEFKDFNEVIQFVNKVAILAEEANHHPDLRIYDYKKLQISLSTHSEGKVTEKDYDLAKKIEQLLS